MEDKIREALEILRDECKKHSISECENDCLIYKLLGECVDANVPEVWEIEEHE